MREGLCAPTDSFSVEELSLLRGYFDAQGRIELVVWVRHEEPGNDPRQYDHHLVLAVDDDDYASGDPWALEWGVRTEVMSERVGWIDVAPRSEVEALRPFGVVVWARDDQPAEDLDRLEFRFTWDPVAVSAEELKGFAQRLDAVRSVLRVEATHERFWKGDVQLEDSERVYVGYDESAAISGILNQVKTVLGESHVGIARTMRRGITFGSGIGLGLPQDPRVRTTVFYSRDSGTRSAGELPPARMTP